MFTVSTEDARSTLYLLEIGIDDKVILKIGITSKNVKERMIGIASSAFSKYRYMPYIKPKRYRKVDNTRVKEQKILNYCKEYAYTAEHLFGGCTELLDMDLDLLVKVYEDVVAGKELVEDGSVCECGKTMKFEKDGRMCCGHGHDEEYTG